MTFGLQTPPIYKQKYSKKHSRYNTTNSAYRR